MNSTDPPSKRGGMEAIAATKPEINSILAINQTSTALTRDTLTPPDPTDKIQEVMVLSE